MTYKVLDKQQTGSACEYYVAAELSRLGYNVTITFGNTKAIDLLVHKNDETFVVQVKGIQRTKSICWNLDKTKSSNSKLILVLVNLHADLNFAKPEFFVLTYTEALALFKSTPKEGDKRAYLDYKKIKGMIEFENRWSVFDCDVNAILK